MSQDIQVVSGGSLTVTGLFRIFNGHTLTVEDGGQVVVNARVDFDSGGTLIMNGGTASFNDTVKFPDNDNGAVYIYLYGGLLTCHDTESYASRGSELHVGGGVMRTGQTSDSRRDPESSDWNIQPIAPYEEIVITDLGGNVKEISAASPVVEVQFALTESGDFETLSPALIDVVLSEAQSETVTAYYFFNGGTAEGFGVDYNLPISDTVVFDPYQTLESISIDIIDDGAGEDDETIILQLYLVTGAEVQLGANLTHTYTIIDPRPSVQFTSPTGIGAENVTPANVSVELSHSWPQTVTVDYTVTGGSATRDQDYILADSNVTFLTGQTTRDIPIDIIADDLEEGSETITLILSNPTGNSKLGGNTLHTFTITEHVSLLRGAFYFRADSDPSARVGLHPDVMVRLGDGDNKLIFRRDNGYAPTWYTQGNPEEDLPIEITRANCGNNVNTYSRVSIIETNPARAIVHWRYAQNCGSISPTGWIDELFTIYPDGICIRTVKNAAGTSFEQWNNAAGDIERLQLLPDGIYTLPAAWLNPADLSIVSGDYTYDNFDENKRCYNLNTNITANPSVLNLTLDTTGGKSIHNPVIVLKNWGDAKAEVTIQGGELTTCFTGYAADMYGDDLVIWLGIETNDSIDVTVTPSGGSAQFINRALPPAQSYDFADSPPLPLGSSEPGPFGAYYTNLPFNDKFDQEYRVGEHADVVVQFDDNAHRFAFWRGTNYQPHLAGDTSETPENPHVAQGVGISGVPYTCWYGTQFIERRGEDWGLPRYLEPMSDQECRFAHVRIISSNAARAIVQWRYAPCHLDYRRNNTAGDPWGDWANEYYTIYPDGMSVRCVTAWSRDTGGADQESPHIEFHEAIPVTNPGTIPEDNIHWNALSATNYAGNKKDWLAQDVDGGAMTNLDQITNRPIMVVRMKGSTVPLTVVEGTSVEHDPVGQHDCRPFNAYDDWPAWPDGDRGFLAGPELDWLWDEDPTTHCYRYFWQQYPSHCSMFHAKWQDYEHVEDVRRVKIMLFGMVDAAQAANVNNLIPLARSWQYAPTLSITSGDFSGGSFDKTERAYKISRDSQDTTALAFTINASSSSPVHNPCFVIENWDSQTQLLINGQPIDQGPDFRQGIEKTADEVPSLVVWIRKEATSSVNIVLSEPCTSLGDLDNSGNIDGIDLGIFVLHWLDPSPACCDINVDMDKNRKINAKDFAIMTARWNQNCP
jgi:hypothetical protein